jgi:hypothetical protein
VALNQQANILSRVGGHASVTGSPAVTTILTLTTITHEIMSSVSDKIFDCSAAF